MKVHLKSGILLLMLLTSYVMPACVTEEKAEWAQLDFTQMAEDAQGDGWVWEADRKTLQLNGLNLCWDGENTSNGKAIIVPEDTTIVLAEGSKNVIRSTVTKKPVDYTLAAISCEGNVTFDGTGSLEIAGQSRYGVEANWGNLIISNGNYIFSGMYEHALDAGGDLIVNQGNIEIADGGMNVDHDLILNGGNVTTYEKIVLRDRMDGSIVLNGGCFKCLPAESKENGAEREFQVIISNEYNRWVVNGGEFYTTGIYNDGLLTVNDGYVEIDGEGLGIGYLGQYVQNGGSVVIRSDYQGCGNRISRSFDNRGKERFVITGGELQITSRDTQFGAVEFIAEKGIALNDYIQLGENMICEPAEWTIVDETAYPFIRQRNVEQYLSEEKTYQILTLKENTPSQDGEFPGAKTVTIREK